MNGSVARICLLVADPLESAACLAICRESGPVVAPGDEAGLLGLAGADGFGLLVLDHPAPLALLSAARAAGFSGRAIVVLDEAGAAELSGLRRAGASAILFKPFAPETLRKALRDELAAVASMAPRRRSRRPTGAPTRAPRPPEAFRAPSGPSRGLAATSSRPSAGRHVRSGRLPPRRAGGGGTRTNSFGRADEGAGRPVG